MVSISVLGEKRSRSSDGMRMFDGILDTLAATYKDAVVEAFARRSTPPPL